MDHPIREARRLLLGTALQAGQFLCPPAHWHDGFFNKAKGIELPLIDTAGVRRGSCFGGPGNFSLDSALGLTGVWAASTIWLVIGIAGLLAFFSLIAPGHPAHTS